jgi:hypothetical protein
VWGNGVTRLYFPFLNPKGGHIGRPFLQAVQNSRLDMGEAKLNKSATARLIEKFPDCCLCGGDRKASTRDHIPPKSLFDKSHRPDRLVMPACGACNGGTSTADLVASIVSRWNFYSDQQEMDDHSRLVARIKKDRPDIVKEWTSLDLNKRNQGRKHLERHGVDVPLGAGIISIGEITIRHLSLFAYKLALGLYFEHFQSPLSNKGRVSAIWRTKEDFGKTGVPNELLEIMPRYATLQQGKWNTSKDFEYRFDQNLDDGIFGCLARFRTGLYVTGFAVRDHTTLPTEEVGVEWIKPSDLLTILTRPEFRRRLQ